MRHAEIMDALRKAQTEEDVEQVLQRATHFSLQYKWANWQNSEVQELGARRRREIREAVTKQEVHEAREAYRDAAQDNS